MVVVVAGIVRRAIEVALVVSDVVAMCRLIAIVDAIE